MLSNVIARAFMIGRNANKVVPSSPGRKIIFHGGEAKITEARDMPHILLLPGATVELNPEYLEFFPDWVRKAGPQAAATVVLTGTDEYQIGPPPTYTLEPRQPQGGVREPKRPKTPPLVGGAKAGWGDG